MYLSKSKYVKGMQCPKMLWMDRNMPEKFDSSVMDEALLAAGNEVGDLAMGYFGAFAEVPYSKDKAEMIQETKKLLWEDTKVICEASFEFKENFCSVDILRVADNGTLEIIEVKSSSNADEGDEPERSDKIAAQYLHDMAYQYYVVTGAGYRVGKISLMQLNRNYERHGELDLEQLFVLQDATEQVLKMQPEVHENIAIMTIVAEAHEEPGDFIGSRCMKPYPCGYKDYCWRFMPENNIYDIGFRMRGSKKDEYYRSGIVSFEDTVGAEMDLSDIQWCQIDTTLHDLPDFVNPIGIREFLSTLSYPLYFLDFETLRQAIPQWDFVRPHMQIPFQYSLHIQERQGGELIHKEFLGKEGADPRRALAERLCADIPKDACTLVYYEPFEKTRLKELALVFPDLADHLMNIHDGIRDLIVPFRKGYFYSKAMGGSVSIKSVLPAMFPDDPELDYHALDLIHNGGEAMNAFPTLHEKSEEEIEKIRAALLAYCRLDTLAMVRILERLYAVVAEYNEYQSLSYSPDSGMNTEFNMIGEIVDVNIFTLIKSGKKMATIKIQNLEKTVQVVIFPEVFAKSENTIRIGETVSVYGREEKLSNGTTSVDATSIFLFSELVGEYV